MTIALPTAPQVRKASPQDARVFLAGVPKVGKTTLFSQWAPAETLILDCEGGTRMLEGEHFVLPIKRYQDFVDAVKLLAAGGHPYKTVGIDTADMLVKLADKHVAEGRKQLAAGVVEYGKGLSELEAVIRRDVGTLLSLDMGVWFLGHVESQEGENGRPRMMVPTVEKRVRPYLVGACDFIFMAERAGGKRVLHTEPSEHHEAGSRVPMPEPIDMDARKLYAAMRAGIKAAAEAEEAKDETTTTTGKGSK